MNLHVEKKQVQRKQASQTPVAQAKTGNTFQLVDNRQTSVIQQGVIQKMDNHGSEVAQLSGKGPGKNNKKQQKQKAAAAAKKKSKQSKADRNARSVLMYETTSKKDVSAKQQAARNIKGNIGHASADKSKGKQGKTKQELAKIREEVKANKKKEELAKRQNQVDKDMKKFHDRSDKDDKGGAGGGHAVPIPAT